MGRGHASCEILVLALPRDASGVLPNQHLEAAAEQGMVRGADGPVPSANIQPASIDLRLGQVAYRVRCSFLPAGQPVARRMTDLILDEITLTGDGAVLTPGHPYLIPLKEQLDLSADLRAKANPKSSTGRADVFTRVITDHSYRFDEVAAGYTGALYLEVVPLSFPVRVREDLTLNQLRISRGRTYLTDDEIRHWHAREPLLFRDNEDVPTDQLDLSAGLFLGVDLRGDRSGKVGHRARTSPPLLDLTKFGHADPAQYWEPVHREAGRRIVLTPKLFYLLMSYEAVTIPPQLAAEMTAYDPTSGELRTHYAGFFDPGFGYDDGDRFRGSTAALEVRAHDVPFMVEHRQPVCKLTFERMLEEPTQLYGKDIGSNYQQQTETLGKHFRGAAAPPPPRHGRQGGRTVSEDQLGLLDIDP
jgi:dCTP deaminase